MAFRCATCGQEHDGLPMDIGFGKPADYFAVPEAERARRCTVTADWCVIDQRRFYIRGCVYVPVSDADVPFAWGVWARVAKRPFERYRALAALDGSQEPLFRGSLCGEHRGYEGLDGHPVMVQMGAAGKRPAFILARSRHLLYREQRDGINLHRVHAILAAMFPQQFAEPSKDLQHE
jgi:hypothetical protein